MSWRRIKRKVLFDNSGQMGYNGYMENVWLIQEITYRSDRDSHGYVTGKTSVTCSVTTATHLGFFLSEEEANQACYNIDKPIYDLAERELESVDHGDIDLMVTALIQKKLFPSLTYHYPVRVPRKESP